MKSIRVEVYCLLFLLILTNGFGRLGFDSHANDLKLWEYLRAQIGTNFFPRKDLYLLLLRSWDCLQYWITLAPGRSANPSCSCFKALHWVAYLFPLICVYHPSFWPNIFSFFFLSIRGLIFYRFFLIFQAARLPGINFYSKSNCSIMRQPFSRSVLPYCSSTGQHSNFKLLIC